MRKLELQLSLLRGESPTPLDMQALGRSVKLRMQLQKKGLLSDRLAINLLGMIASGRLLSGSQIPPERRIAEVVGVSRVSVRSALSQIKDLGYIEAMPGSGTRITRDSEKLKKLRYANQINMKDLGQFCEFLDDLLVERALQQSSRQDRKSIAAALTIDRKQLSSFKIARLEFEMRMQLANISGSTVLQVIVAHLERGLTCYFNALFSDSTNRHQVSQFVSDSHRLAAKFLSNNLADVRSAMVIRNQLSRTFHMALNPNTIADKVICSDNEFLDELTANPPEKLRNIVAREIIAMIAAGEFKESNRLLSERRLADLFGVNRVSVRKALLLLKEKDMLVTQERSFTKIKSYRWNKLDLPELIAHDIKSYENLCSLRLYLEVGAARRAAKNATDKDCQKIRRIIREMRRTIDTPDRMVNLDLNLHLTIAQAAGSALSLFISEVVRKILPDYFNFTMIDTHIAGRTQTELEQHAMIVDAILAKDAHKAGQIMDLHIRAFKDRLLAASNLPLRVHQNSLY